MKPPNPHNIYILRVSYKTLGKHRKPIGNLPPFFFIAGPTRRSGEGSAVWIPFVCHKQTYSFLTSPNRIISWIDKQTCVVSSHYVSFTFDQNILNFMKNPSAFIAFVHTSGAKFSGFIARRRTFAASGPQLRGFLWTRGNLRRS